MSPDEPKEMPDFMEIVMRGYTEHLHFMALAIRVAAEMGSAAGIEVIADFLDNHDAMMDGDGAAYEVWDARPDTPPYAQRDYTDAFDRLMAAVETEDAPVGSGDTP